MKKIYKDPRKLATCLKDTVDAYWDELITYEELEEKIVILAHHNLDKLFSNGTIPVKISNVLGDARTELIKKIVTNQKDS